MRGDESDGGAGQMATGRGHDEVARARDGQTTAHRALWEHSCPPPLSLMCIRACAPRCCIEGLLGARGGCQTGRGPPSSAFDGGLGCGAIGGGCSRLAPRRVPESGGRGHSTEAVSRVLFSRSGRGRPGGVPPPAPGARGAPAAAPGHDSLVDWHWPLARAFVLPLQTGSRGRTCSHARAKSHFLLRKVTNLETVSCRPRFGRAACDCV